MDFSAPVSDLRITSLNGSSCLRRSPSPSLGTPESTSVDSAHSGDEEWQLRETAKALRRAFRMNKFRIAALNYKRKLEFKSAMATSFFQKYHGALGSIWELQTRIDVLKADLLAQQEAHDVRRVPGERPQRRLRALRAYRMLCTLRE